MEWSRARRTGRSECGTAERNRPGEAEMEWSRARRVRLRRGVAPSDELAGDGDPLDLVGALADAKQRGVAVVALDVILRGVPVGPVDAHGLGGVLERGFR